MIRSTLVAWIADVRFIARSVLRHPRQGAEVWLISLIWIALAPALLALLGALQWSSLPVPQPQRLVQINAGLDLLPVLEKSGLFQAVSHFETGWVVVSKNDAAPRTALAASVDPGFFEALGTRAVLGRVLSSSEDARDGAVLALSLFRALFGPRDTLTGANVRVGDRDLAVIGVIPDRPRFPGGSVVWVLGSAGVSLDNDLLPRGVPPVGIVGRLAGAASLAGVNQAVMQAAEQLGQVRHTAPGDVEVVPLERIYRRNSGGERALIRACLGGLLAFVFLAYSVSLSAYLLERRHEFFVRVAVGAGRLDLARLVLLRTVALSAPGLVIGLPLSAFALSRLTSLVPFGLAELIGPRIDFGAVALAIAAWVAAIAISSLVVWLSSAKWAGLSLVGPSGSPASAGHRSANVRLAFVTAALALAVALGAFAFLAHESLLRLEHQPLGFQPERLTSVVVRFRQKQPAESLPAVLEKVADRLRRIEGISSVGFSDSVLYGYPGRGLEVAIPGRPEVWLARVQGVFGDYFGTLGLRPLLGRTFSRAELEMGAKVAMIDADGAHELFGVGPPVGQSIRVGGQVLEIVGVVPTTRASPVQTGDRPQVYRPMLCDLAGSTAAVVALVTTTRPLHGDSLAEGLASVPAAPGQVEPVKEQVENALSSHRLAEELAALHWGSAMVLVFLATFGTFSWLLRARSFEFAVRMALGDTENGIRLRVARLACSMTALACVLGLAMYTPVALSIKALVIGTDPFGAGVLATAVLSGAALTFAAVALAAWEVLTGVSPSLLKGERLSTGS